MRYILAIDVQRDFVTGALGTAEARAMIPALEKKLRAHEGAIWLTQDSHGQDYLDSQEGRRLPQLHAQRDSEGWRLLDFVEALVHQGRARVFEKSTFASLELALAVRADWEAGLLTELELVGLCTDICLVSNALLIKAHVPELALSVDPRCCAGTSPERHRAALLVLESCQVELRS